MSKKAFAQVQRAFPDEAARAFEFLSTEHGFAGPQPQGVVLPVISFAGSRLRYRIMLDPDEMSVLTRIDLDLDGTTRLTADLEDLVQAAGIGARNQVARTAHSMHGLQKALQSQANYARAVQPRLESDTVVDLLRKAKARERRIQW